MSHNLYTYSSLQKLLVLSLYQDQSMIPRIGTIINRDDFDNDVFGQVYERLLDFSSQNKTATHEEIFYNVKNSGVREEEISFLLTERIPKSPLTLAKMLKEESVKHKTKNQIKISLEDLENNSLPITEVLHNTEQELAELAKSMIVKEEKTFADVLHEEVDYMLQKEVEQVDSVPLFYECLKEPLGGGFKPEKLITIGARTGIGKSVFAVNSTIAACAAGRSVLFFSLEMNSKELIQRIISAVSGVLLYKLAPGFHKTEDEIDRIKKAEEEIAKWKLNIDETPDVTTDYIKSKAKIQAQSEQGLDFIILDYLQLVNPGTNTKGKNREQIVAEQSRNMKLLAKTLKVPVMILVQLNREHKNDDEDRLPSKADIRESGAIAQDSDIIVIIHRKNRDESTDPKAIFILDKNRGGPADRKYYMRAILEKSMFKDIEKDEAPIEETAEAFDDVIVSTSNIDTNDLDTSFLDDLDDDDFF